MVFVATDAVIVPASVGIDERRYRRIEVSRDRNHGRQRPHLRRLRVRLWRIDGELRRRWVSAGNFDVWWVRLPDVSVAAERKR
jgi:hypothetical protein